ncbi:fe-S cluster assembly factor HCF101, chloroplastic isoform X1 [Olea europaea subsp. europaea]|uniref:Fe-S cluster assembly factor HCF101, chloroplastic isoform X1 n=1 Tax=Olea europaea subsp. europaea TaxID=158383 RepID=A0A8S0RT10_OLEEU|nr:fe-S cluster assembly factor HCF101, chloroplastic isoform X1 [Olea europaea subsp. europaea]
MQLLRAPCSSTLQFHFSNSQPRGRHERPAWVSFRDSAWSAITPKAASIQASASTVSSQTAEIDVLKSLSQIIDPDFGTDIVSCGFVKDLNANKALGEVSFRLELTTPACPVKDMFEQQASEVVATLPWVKKVSVTMSARPARPVYAGNLPENLQTISNIIAVSSCKVPCVAVVENMCHFDANGKRYYPFGKGSGSQVVEQFGIPHLFELPIRPTLSASGDSGIPEVVSDPQGEVARTFQELGICVVQQCAKICQQGSLIFVL